MPYLVIGDFKNGMDRRRPQSVGVPGSLWKAENCVITRGGDIEKARKFAELYSLAPGTHGLAVVRGQLQVYSHTNVTMPPAVSLQILAAPNTPDMEKVLDVKTPGGLPYVIAKYADGNIYHFYDGQRVTDWDTLASGVADFASVAAYLAWEMDVDPNVRVTAVDNKIIVQARVPGVPFSLSASAVDGGNADDQTAIASTLVSNVVEVDWVTAEGSVEITGGGPGGVINDIQVDNVSILSQPVNWSTSATATANLVAQQINNGTSDHGYSAVADGAVIEIMAPPLSGTAPNGFGVVSFTSGGLTTIDTNMAGGVDYVAPVAQQSQVAFGGTFEEEDLFTVTLNGAEYKVTGLGSAMGTFGIVHKARVYAVAYGTIHFSEISDFDDFGDSTPSSGAGFIALSGSSGATRAVGLGRYQDRVAVFADNSITTFFLEADSTANAEDQNIENVGTVAPHSIIQYGNNDLFYLDETGIRSLRARDSSNAATTDDVGTLIDDYVTALRDSQAPGAVRNARAAIEPKNGRYMLAIGEEVIALSRFPASKITAWTVLKPGFSISNMVRLGRDLYVRSDNSIYVYGGPNDDDFVDADECVVETPFLDAGTPATHKQFTGFDVVCSGTWKFEILTDPNDVTKSFEIARVISPTLNKLSVGLSFKAAIFAVRATCLSDGPAQLSSLIFHHEKVEAA